ncbi:MAG: helix-turn-helix transcriptional regulator [Deltaproteobacteria bacterium]|nr:helix-turn-helix transcriptional regulator [Deltaproteobacteria bacterium]
MKKYDLSVIRNLRRKMNITAEELAEKAGITRATVAKLEKGQGNPTIETLDALSQVFQLSAGELIRLAEVSQCEMAGTRRFKAKGFEGSHIQLPGFEIYHFRAKAGQRKDSDPRFHQNTAEVCLVLSGKIKAIIRGHSYELGPDMALRFKALHEHYFDIIEDAEFLLIHHSWI